MLLDNLELFLHIVERGGMAIAGREMGLSPATVSERLTSLEAYYDARLLNRTTRSIHLTDEGRVLAEGARKLLAEANDLESRIKLGVTHVSGPIRITAPVDLGRNKVAPTLNEFKEVYPEVNIDLYLDDGYMDLVSSGIDLGIRYGELPDSSLRAKKVGDNRRLVCASPDYIKQHGRPKAPEDLQYHKAVLMRFGQNIEQYWRFTKDGKVTKVAMQTSCVVNDGELVRQWCKAGHGIALKSIWDVRNDIKNGKLISLLEDYTVPSGALQIVYPGGRTGPRRVRLLIDFIAKKLQPYGP